MGENIEIKCYILRNIIRLNRGKSWKGKVRNKM